MYKIFIRLSTFYDLFFWILIPNWGTDFPIRDHKVILRIRCRRWTDIRTGKSFTLPIDLDIVAKGTRYSKEFGVFLKRRMETSPVTCHTLEEYYHIEGHTFEKQYPLAELI